MIANRLSGAAVAILGVALIWWIIPANTETVDQGWIRPQTIPDICAVVLIALGLIHAAVPTGEVAMSSREVTRVGLFAALAGAGLWTMDRFGFVVGAPLLALLVMLLVGERRPFWLAAGVVALPGIIWVAVVPLLERTLP